VETNLESIAWQALSRSWPTTNGPRNFRVLCTILRRLKEVGCPSLTLMIGLRELAIHSGLGDTGRTIRDALDDLEADGWLKWTVGSPYTYVNDHAGHGQPSQIELIPQQSQGRYPVNRLPLPTLEPFLNGLFFGDRPGVGSPGYLVMARVLFTRKEGPFNLKGLEALTGMKYDRVKDLMPKMSKAGLAWKVKSKYTFVDSEYTQDRQVFGDNTFRERMSKLHAERLKDGMEDEWGISTRVDPNETEEQRASRHMRFEQEFGRPAPDAMPKTATTPQQPEPPGSSPTSRPRSVFQDFDGNDESEPASPVAKVVSPPSGPADLRPVVAEDPPMPVRNAMMTDLRTLHEFEDQCPSDEDLVKLWQEAVPADRFRRNRVAVRVLQHKPDGTFWSHEEIEERTDRCLEEEILSEAKRWAFAEWESGRL